MKTIRNVLALVVIFFLSGCSSSLYDHYTLTETLETKVQTESLIRQSVNPYPDYIAQVESLKGTIEKMVLYERSKSKNPITIKMWEHLNNDMSSVHQFLKLWKEKETLSLEFTEEFSKQTNEIFQLMIDYETKKDKASESALSKLINAL